MNHPEMKGNMLREFKESVISALGKFWLAVVVLFVIAFMSGCSYRWFFLAFVDNYELPFKYNTFTGQIERLPHTGYIRRMPFRDQITALTCGHIRCRSAPTLES